MKIALAQINTATGDLEGNEKKIRQFLKKAAQEKAELVVFPELALVGYPPRDHLFQHGFLDRAAQIVQNLAKDYSELSFVLGSAEKNSNVAYFISSGKIQSTCRKNLLPNYDVFDERRYFRPGSELETIQIHGKNIGISICEDIWAEEIPVYNNDPMKQFRGKKLDFIINISASPFNAHKFEKRFRVIAKQAKNLTTPVVHVNLVGGNDELIFDGGSFSVDASGNLVSQAPFFEETLHCFEFSKNKPVEENKFRDDDRVIQAITLGLKDFVRKCGFQNVVLGLSGGIDSALVTLLAVEALGKKHVHIVFMPSQYTSKASKEDVETISQKLDMPLTVVSIDEIVVSYEKNLKASWKKELQGLTLENIQSRVRANLLMAFSGEKNAMLLNTGNKSEIATGYCTLYGDTVGGIAPIGDLYKYQVYEIANRLNQKYGAIPERVFTRAPSAELHPNQKDSDRLPEYDILDKIIERYVEHHESQEDLIKQGLPQKDVEAAIQLIMKNEFKRKQTAPILRVSTKAFGMGRRMPIARKQYDI